MIATCTIVIPTFSLLRHCIFSSHGCKLFFKIFLFSVLILFMVVIIYMKKLLDSDWLRLSAVQR